MEREGNESSVADHSRMMISMFNELKENIQKQLKEFQENTNQKLERTQKQLNELRIFNKLQNETKVIKNQEIYEIKKIAQGMKEELNKDMESHGKKNQTEILEIKISLNQMKNTIESHSSRLEQVWKTESQDSKTK
jgi:hypothetical protein